jgi:hypothetical protein
MRSQRNLTGLIKFLTRDNWKFALDEVMEEHFAPRRRRYSSTKLRPSGSISRPRKASNARPHKVMAQPPPHARYRRL